MRRPILAAVCGVLLLTLTACATGGPMTEPTPPSASSATPFPTQKPGRLTPSPSEPLPTGESMAVPPAKWDAILADLEARGVEGEPIVVSSEAVTWSNGSLGCPKPGMSYTQALVDGMRVVVEVDGTTYDYRFGTSDRPKLCES